MFSKKQTNKLIMTERTDNTRGSSFHYFRLSTPNVFTAPIAFLDFACQLQKNKVCDCIYSQMLVRQIVSNIAALSRDSRVQPVVFLTGFLRVWCEVSVIIIGFQSVMQNAEYSMPSYFIPNRPKYSFILGFKNCTHHMQENGI